MVLFYQYQQTPVLLLGPVAFEDRAYPSIRKDVDTLDLQRAPFRHVTQKNSRNISLSKDLYSL